LPDDVVLAMANEIMLRYQQPLQTSNSHAKALEVRGHIACAKKEASLYFNKVKELQPNLKPEKIAEAAMLWAVWQWIGNNYQQYGCPNEIFATAYCAETNHFTGDNIKYTFLNYYNRIKKEGIENVVIPKVKPVKSRQPDKHVEALKAAFVSSNTTTAKDMHRALEQLCAQWGEKCMSYENVKIYFRKFDKDIELHAAKRGAKAAAMKVPYLSMENAQHRDSLWFQDGKVLPFFTQKESEAGAERYTVSLLMDSHSQMIVEYGIGKSENAEMIFDVLYKRVCSSGVLAPEIITDKHSGLRTGVGVNFIAEYEKMGGTFTATTNPQAKARLERKNAFLDAFWKQFSNYLGQGQTAKGKNARPSTEELNEAFKSKNYKTIDETKALAIAAIDHYNNTPQSCLNGLTPKQAYGQSQSKYAYNITTEDRVRLFRPVKPYLIRRGQININIGTVKYEYMLNAEQYHIYNDCEVNVAYEELRDEIYLFEIKTGAFIGTVPPKPRIPGAKVDRTPEHDQLLNKFAGRKKGIFSKSKKANDAALIGTMKNCPEFVDDVNYLMASKDIAKVIQGNRHLQIIGADYGVRVENMPIRGEKPVIDTTALPKAIKTKESPYNSRKADMGIMTMEELITV